MWFGNVLTIINLDLDLAEFIAACSANCASCDSAGAAKCDLGQCDPGYGLDAAVMCQQCASFCSSCVNAGAGKCESNACNNRYIYVPTTQICQGGVTRNESIKTAIFLFYLFICYCKHLFYVV